MEDIQIHNVTPEESALLDIMWSFDKLEEMRLWQRCLPIRQQRMVDVLYEMLNLAIIDSHVKEDENCDLAKKILEDILKNDSTRDN